jgi:cytochrome P450
MACAIAHTTISDLESSAPASLARYPEESWILGSARAYTRNGLEFYQRCERLAGIVQTRFLWKNAYIITDPGAIADVLVNHPRSFIKPYVLRRLKVLFGDGLLTSDGDLWMRHRRLIQPAFSAEQTPSFIEVVRNNAEEMASRWRHGEERDVYSDLVELCMKNVAQTMFGVYDEELGNIVRALAATCHELVHAVFDVIRPTPFRFPRRLQRRVEQELSELSRYLDQLIDKRSGKPSRRDFLGLLLSSGGQHPPLSRQAIVDESVTMLLAGHETTTSALAWSLYLLARHPQQADALASDLASELNGDAPDYTELEKLESLRATLDEALRLYPPTHRIARTVSAPVIVGGNELPVGSDVVLPQWAVHRSPRWYHAPEAFRPSRWSPSFRKSLPKFAYFPFSGGARTCVGSQLAWAESAVILALLTQRFRFVLSDSAPLVPYEGLTMVPAAGHLRMKLERRPKVKHKRSAFDNWTKPSYTELW